MGSFEPTSLEGSLGVVGVGFVGVVIEGVGRVTSGIVCLFLLVITTAATMKIIESKMESAAIYTLRFSLKF